MKATLSRWVYPVMIVLAAIALAISAWLYFYHNQKNLDNIPSKELVVGYLQNSSEDYAKEKLAGYTIDQLIEIWGEPDGEFSGLYGYYWKYEDANINVLTDPDNVIMNVKLNVKSSN